MIQAIVNRSSNSLEWIFTSPPKPHAFVCLPLQSGCIHFAHDNYCVICELAPNIMLEIKKNCTHTFVPLVNKVAYLGAKCDFSGADHIAVIHPESKVFICNLCEALSCIVCVSP